MVYDPSTSRLVIHGGSNGTNVFSDMWFYLHPAGWGPVTSTGSPARAQHGMVFDAGRSRIVLFGGTTSVNGSLSPYTFEFAAPAWSIASTTGPSPVLPLLGYDAASARCVLLAANMDTWIYPAPAVLSSPGDQTALPGASVTFIAIPGRARCGGARTGSRSPTTGESPGAPRPRCGLPASPPPTRAATTCR
jgi:hypothetical protein